MMNALLIGSVVEVDEIGEQLIIGMRLEIIDGKAKPLYVAVPYPLGFFDINSVVRFGEEKIKNVFYERKDSLELTDRWSNGYVNLLNTLEGKTEDECQRILNVDSMNE